MNKSFLLVWLLFLGSIGLATAQNRQVQGVVKSAEGETLPGVTVLQEGTSNGASTGVDGGYSLSIPAAGAATAKLRFSFVGFVSKEVTVGDQSTINVTLASDSKQLEDVVVIGYQAVQRRDVTGSVSSVGAQQIKDIPVNSAAEALTGRLAGVQLTSSEGTPGNQSVQIRVRGGGSVTQDNSPLFIVDGVQIENALSVIAPQDIASVDVLKDASATAIYGARGANGVVIITTKGGREGKTVVTYNGFAGVRQLTKKLPVMDPTHFLDYQYERAANTGTLSSFKSFFGSRDYANVLGDTLQRSRNSPFLDWQQQVFGRDAFQQTHNVSLSGGGKGLVYSLSLTRNDEQGIQLGSDYTRNLLNFRMDNTATDKFKFGVSVRFNDQTNNGQGTTNGNLSTTSTRLRNSIQYIPLAVTIPGALDPNVFDETFSTNANLVNPVIAIGSDYRNENRKNINLGANAGFNFTKDLAFRSTVGFDLTFSTLQAFSGRYSPALRQPGGNFNLQPFAALTNGFQQGVNNSNVLTYKHKIGDHSFDALVGEEIYQLRATTQNIQTNFLPLDITPERAFANINQGVLPVGTLAQPNNPTTGVALDSRLLSGFGRLNYAFKDRYLATFTFRADGSSKFKQGQRTGYFPAASLAWRVSQEDFFKPLANVVSDMKVRLSYGLAGNNRIADFLTDQYFQTGLGIYALNHSVVQGTAANALANPDLKWETTHSRNLGVDLALFNNRAQFTVDAYYNTTNDLLINVPIAPVSGYSSQLQNVGATSNRGLEFQLTGTVVQTPSFTWSANANLAANRGRIEDLGPLPATGISGISSAWASTAISQDYLARVGDPVGLMYGYVTDFNNGGKGFYTVDDFTGYNATTKTWNLKPGVPSDFSVQGQAVAPGVIKLQDVNGDGVVDANDRTVIGNAQPKLVGGLNQQFTYHGFDASVFLNFVYGNQIYNANKIDFTSSITPYTNLLASMNDRYRTIDANGQLITDSDMSRQVNQNAQIWQPTRQLFFHSWAVEDGSFIRLNNLTIGYSLPKTLIARAKLAQLRFYATANNLYTLTKYTGYDPEVNTRRATPLTPGVDYAGYPRSRALLFGVNISL